MPVPGGHAEAGEGALLCGGLGCGQVLECVMLWLIWLRTRESFDVWGCGLCRAVVCRGQCVCGTAVCGSLHAWSVSTACAGVVSDCGVCDCEV